MKSTGNVLVTGGAGYIGSHFSKLARKAGFKPVIYDNLSTGHRKFVKDTFVEGDLLETDKLAATIRDHKIEFVVHFAAKALVGESMEKPELYFRNNVGGTQSLLKAIEKSSVKTVLFSSSCAVYGKAQTEKIREDHPKSPTNPYGQSKLDCEKELMAFREKNQIHLGCLRYFNVVGQDPEGELHEEHEPETHIVPNLVKAIRKKGTFHLFGTQFPTPDGTAVRDYVDVVDLGEVHLEALNYLSNNNLLISNVGSGRGYSNKEVLSAAEKVFGGSPKVQLSDARPGDPPSLIADGTFFRTWYKKPLKSLEESMRNLK